MSKLTKSLSVQNIKSNKAGSVASSSLKGTKTNFKFREPYYAPLHSWPQNNEEDCKNNLKKWREKRTLCPPKRRSFHTSCIYEETEDEPGDYLYIFGGKDITEGKLSDIIKINLNLEKPKWVNVIPKNNEFLEPLAYHTGTLVGDKYYIIGGNDKYIRQSGFIYIYDLKEKKLEKIKVEKNEDVCYLSMHSADYNQAKNEIILFGGYSEGEMLNTIYRFNIEAKEITKIDSAETDVNKIPLPRTGHASFISDNNLYIFGGTIKDGGLLNDLWKLNLETVTWEKLLPKDNNNTDNNNNNANDNNNSPENENNNENAELNNNQNQNNSSNNECLLPSPRSGHSIVFKNNNEVYIFGGKIGNFQESNDLWKYDISSNQFTLLHDSMLEQFTDEEIEEFKREENKKKKKKGSDFHFITKKEMDDKVNPFSKLYTENKGYNKKFLFKSKSTKEINVNDYEKEIFVNPGYYQMKHSSIFNLDNKDVNSGILALDMLLPYKVGDQGIKIPLPRDGQSLEFYNKENQLILFGGDRNKYPFNDLYFFNL